MTQRTLNIASILIALFPLLVGIAIALFLAWPAHARDDGQWKDMPVEMRDWYRTLMQPDNPQVSCCGTSDAYYADSFEVDGDSYVAIITDERDDGPLGRPHIPPGTRFAVPNQKLKFDRGNPTGHGVIFIGTDKHVLCYVVPGGV